MDVSILSIDDDVYEIKATSGDTHLGGHDFDNILVDYFVQEFKRKHKLDLTKYSRAMKRLRTQCERAKRRLSIATRANIEIYTLCMGIDFVSSITRAKFEELCMNYFQKCLECVRKVLQDAKMSKSEIDDIILVGGSARIPKIQQMIKQYFKRQELCTSIEPNEAVACGAVVQAAILSGNEMGNVDALLIDVIPLSMGVEVEGAIMAKGFERNKTIPFCSSETFTTHTANQSSIIFRIYEGEKQLTKDNNLLGTFKIMDIPPAPRGVPQIQVKFDLDKNGILKVSAGTHNGRFTIDEERGRLSQDEINKMAEEGEKYKEEDEKQRQKCTAKTNLEGFAYQMRNKLNDVKFKNLLKDDDTQKAERTIKETIDWVDNNPNAELKEFEAKKKELEDLWNPIVMNACGAQRGPTIDDVD